ncbi:MAG: hypothetical protein LBT95_07685 [Treponema sp.]|jgi:hypothetical protein|nr:hypothetical protein [Treponema sp.]
MGSSKAAGACLLLGLLLAAVLGAGNTGKKARDLETAEVSGWVRLVGSGIWPEVVISAADGEWYINRKEQNQFIPLQQRWIRVEGKVDFWEMVLADGASLGKRRILRDIRFLEPALPPP